jgi:hypothetical protein
MPAAQVFFSVVYFFVLFTAFWIFIGIFADIFKRHDLSGPVKAGWVLVLVILPIVGGLVYIVRRPRRDEEDAQMVAEYEARRSAKPTTSMGEEIVKLSALHDSGAIDDAEFVRLKRQLM